MICTKRERDAFNRELEGTPGIHTGIDFPDEDPENEREMMAKIFSLNANVIHKNT
jgi:hypothetical protein